MHMLDALTAKDLRAWLYSALQDIAFKFGVVNPCNRFQYVLARCNGRVLPTTRRVRRRSLAGRLLGVAVVVDDVTTAASCSTTTNSGSSDADRNGFCRENGDDAELVGDRVCFP